LPHCPLAAAVGLHPDAPLVGAIAEEAVAVTPGAEAAAVAAVLLEVVVADADGLTRSYCAELRSAAVLARIWYT
jgi:hypothetical protein